MNASSDRLIAAPTIIILRQLSAALVVYRSLVALFEGERNRVVHCVIPKLAGSRELVFPWDPEYPSLPGEGAQWDSASMAAHTGLPSRLEVPS